MNVLETVLESPKIHLNNTCFPKENMLYFNRESFMYMNIYVGIIKGVNNGT